MSKRKKILLIAGGSAAVLVVMLATASLLILQSSWFSGLVREKIIAATEESTGGTVELGSFQFDWPHLTVRIRDFVLHGTEPKTADPLARVQLLELRLRLFSGIANLLDLSYFGVQKPQLNLMVFPDGKTNIPEPRVPKKASDNNGLETVVNLKIGEFQLQDGLLEYQQQTIRFGGRGENLRAVLNYNAANPSYTGSLSIDPLRLTSGNRPPLDVRVRVPITIEKDAVRIANATLGTAGSRIALDAAVQHLNAPVIDAHLSANVSLPELQRSIDLSIDPNAAGAPKELTAELGVHMDDRNKVIQVQTAHLALGDTTFQSSGTVRDVSSPASAANFNGNLALAQLSRLLKLSGSQVTGAVLLNGTARVDARNDYQVNGALNTRDVSIRSGATAIEDLKLYSPFHADPYLVSLDGLKLGALGGTLAAKVFVEKMQQLSVQGRLQNFSLPVLAAILTGKQLGYDGTIDGTLTATADLKATGTKGYRARANLAIVPGTHGIPLRGQINAAYAGATGAIRVDPSYIALPNSRLDLSGAINQRLDVKLVSHNLNDFLPAANFGAKTPLTSLPVVLQGGTASLEGQLTGNLSTPQIASHLSVTSFAVRQAMFDNLALDVSASQSGATIRNGVLARNTLRTVFDASLGLQKWAPVPGSPLNANLTMRNATVTELLTMAGSSDVPATGDVTADAQVNGTYGNPLGHATVQVLNGTAYDQPFNHLSAQVNLADQLITLAPLELDSSAGKIDVTARFQHPRDSFTTGTAQMHVTTSNVQLGNLKPLQAKSPGAAGTIQLTADAAASIRQVNQQTSVDLSSVSADLSAHDLQVQNQSAGGLTASARTTNGAATYQVVSDFAGSDVKVNGRTTLAANYPTSANASIQNLSVAKLLSLTGQTQIPATGTFSAHGKFAGTLATPTADLTFQLADANVYEEPIERLAGSVHYANTLLDIPSIQLDTPAGSLTMAGSVTHPANDFASGAVKLNLKSTDIALDKIQHIHQQQPTMAGVVHLGANLTAAIREQHGKRILLISSLDADASAHTLRMNHQNLGQADFTAKTAGSTLNFQLDSDIAQSRIHGAGHSQLTGDYLTQAELSFTNIKYTNIEPFIPAEAGPAPSFEVLVDGEASLNGPALNPDALTARLQLNQLSAETHRTATPTGAPPARSVKIQNQGPIVIALNKSVVSVQQFHLGGLGTVVNASGAINLKDDTAPIDLKLDSNVDLGMLQDLDRGFYSKGAVSMTAAVHGSFSQPLINGRIELKNANVNYATAPNGLSNANGVILLTGTGASIQNLTGESGGGKITVTGFAGLTGRSLTYNLKANASKVRVRYSGISVTTTSSLELVGSTRRSVLSGNITVQRIAYNSSSDAGSLLSSFAAKPPSTPSAPSGLLTGMRLNIRILTAPDLRVSTTYADRLSVEANLTVRGTAVDPGMLGRLVVTEGKLVFFGNTYTVNTGAVNFYNPTSIEPVVNISLETLAQGVDVTLGVSGPMDNLQLKYRSDPPLTFEQIVQLLATNTTPNDPNIVANQPPAPQQSFTQMGESAVLGQAVANPLASRVQRVFGLNQFKIDPSVAGVTGQPTARVTLQQKIFNNVTFTYITDVTQTNSQIVRVQWDLTPKLSAIGLRDYNGNVSIEFGYKFTVR